MQAVLLLLLYRAGQLTYAIITNAVLTTVFGAYFCFFARKRLPSFYDEQKISGIIDGVVRMNVPGLHFNNSNWPHIVKVGRAAMLAAMLALPISALVIGNINRGLWAAAELYVMLVLLLAGLFIPIYIIGKKYE